MKKMKRLGALALALVTALSVLTACGGKEGGTSSGSAAGSGSGAGSSSQIKPMDLAKVTDPYLTVSGLAGDEVVAKLGSGEITAAEYLYWLNRVIGNYLSQFGGQMSTLPWDTEMSEGRTFGQEMLDQAADMAAFHCTLRLLAQEEGLTPDPSVASDISKQYADLVVQAGDEIRLLHAYWASMLTKDLLIKLTENSNLYDQLQEKYFGEESGHYPTDAEVQAYLDESGQYRAKHILLRTVDDDRQPLDEETIAQKKATADDLLAQLRAAEDPIALFDQLMNEYSEDTGLAANPDGYTTSKGQMVEPFETAALALQSGEISDVVESEFGYHIILRLPMDPAEFREECISSQMSELLTLEQERLGLEKTDALNKLDVGAFWNNMLSLQYAVQTEANQ